MIVGIDLEAENKWTDIETVRTTNIYITVTEHEYMSYGHATLQTYISIMKSVPRSVQEF